VSAGLPGHAAGPSKRANAWGDNCEQDGPDMRFSGECSNSEVFRCSKGGCAMSTEATSILIVDDDLSIRRLLSAVLARSGYLFVTANDASPRW